jgi:hypothetical protein
MKQLLKKINKYSLEASVAIIEKDSLKGVTEDDVDNLAEAISLLNDIYEELYDKVFDTGEEE